MSNEQRTRIWVHRFQTRLALRIGAYLSIFLVVLLNFLFAWRLWQEGPGNPAEQFGRMLRDYLPFWVCLLALVPVVAWDAVRFTHRLVGPLVRIRQTVQDLAQGEAVRPIKLRDGDYLGEFRDDFNRMLETLQRRGLPVLRPRAPDGEDEDGDRRTSA
jgi:hypothetical protein